MACGDCGFEIVFEEGAGLIVDGWDVYCDWMCHARDVFCIDQLL